MRILPFAVLLNFAAIVQAYPDGSRIPAGNAGEPATGTPCAQCHGVTLNPSGGKVELTLPAGSTYRAGERRTWVVRITDADSSRRYGFQLTASAGTFSAGSNSVVVSSDSRQYISHRSSSASYTFEWTPPASSTANISVYLAGGACRGRRDTRVYTLSQTLTAATALPVVSSNQGVVNSASFAPVVTPSAWITIFGENFSPSGITRTWSDSDIVDGSLPRSLEGTSVKINGKDAALSYISPTQINALAPADESSGPVAVQVTTSAGTSPAVSAQMVQQAPSLFRFDAEGGRYAAAIHPDGALAGKPGLYGTATALRAPTSGDIIQLFGTGFGASEPAAPDLKVFTGAYPFQALATLHVRLDGVEAEVSFAGRTSPGLDQINVKIPTLAAGDHKVEVEINGVVSTTTVYLYVK